MPNIMFSLVHFLLIVFWIVFLLLYVNLQYTKTMTKIPLFTLLKVSLLGCRYSSEMQKIPFAIKWTLKEDDLKALAESDGYKFLETKYLSTLYGVKYYLQIYPNGNRENNHGKVYIFFGMDIDNLKKVEVKYTVRSESTNGFSQEREDVFEESTAWGEYFCDTVDLFNAEKRFIIDGKLILKFNGIIDFGVGTSASITRYSKIGNELWADDEGKDFLVIVGGKEIMVHKVVLAAASPIFDEMLKSKTKEAIENQIEIFGMSFNAVEVALKSMYDCHGGYSFSFDDEMLIIKFFDTYGIPYLKDRFEGLLINKISAATVCRIANCAFNSNAKKLQEKCMNFLMDSFASKIPLAGLDELDKDILLKIFNNALYNDVKTD